MSIIEASTLPRGRNMYRKPQTNADRIRAMTDEELADIFDSDWCAILCNDGVSDCDADCHSKILKWLKQEDET